VIQDKRLAELAYKFLLTIYINLIKSY